VTPAKEPAGRIGMRAPDAVMRLDRLGSFHQTRLSFLRAMLRRAEREAWRLRRPLFSIDAAGVGTAVYTIYTPGGALSLVAFSHDLPAEQRTDRVIAEAWDSTFALYDGVPDRTEIERLHANVPLQEAGRYLPSDLVLARANRSVRLFETVVAALASGRQPDAGEIESVGYLMRTTAVYGNGKFGIADRDAIAARPELAGPFRAEMLTVWLIRAFTCDLVEAMARQRAPATAVPLEAPLRRRLGIGNATGLGMAPFLVKHPVLIDRWITARETALARVRARTSASAEQKAVFGKALRRARSGLTRWTTVDPVQQTRLLMLATDLESVSRQVEDGELTRPMPWDALYRWSQHALSLEGQEYVVSLLLEPHGDLVDDLADAMAADEAAAFRIDGTRRVADVCARVDRHYGWVRDNDFECAEANARFWYVSEEKLEPRLGERHAEPGADREHPLATARDVVRLRADLGAFDPQATIAAFLLAHAEHRHTVRRVQIAERHPYGEIRANLIDATMRPIDMLRAKLSFFGCTRFDPRSDKWLRITLFQGAPFPHEIGGGHDETWIYGPEAA